MKTWIKTCCVWASLVGLAACTTPLYREEFNFNTTYAAYAHYRVVETHPFDDVAPDPALSAALTRYLEISEYTPAQGDDGLARQLIFVLNLDVEAGRRRVLALAANDVRTWVYAFNKDATAEDLIAIEIYERQTGNMIYRAENQRLETADASIAVLLSGFPPSGQRTARLRSRAP